MEIVVYFVATTSVTTGATVERGKLLLSTFFCWPVVKVPPAGGVYV